MVDTVWSAGGRGGEGGLPARPGTGVVYSPAAAHHPRPPEVRCALCIAGRNSFAFFPCVMDVATWSGSCLLPKGGWGVCVRGGGDPCSKNWFASTYHYCWRQSNPIPIPTSSNLHVLIVHVPDYSG